ncbi:tetratricopeptide repeat protein [Membranihabitans maritimus]|uniref:tetratricopeptide repeat protein n=1 Tax=Membranihabitans maritimus TaxID=2904244 RepID=UPI001F27A32C|nr:hypothetical protein [Membranihabitans maritimus]
MKRLLIVFLVAVSFQVDGFSQCKTWNDSPQKEAGENAHSIYRPLVRNEKYEQALPHWQKAYNIAPAADGRRDYHYMDGIAIYKHFFQNETDEAKKEEYKQKVLELYQGAIDCYEARVIKVRDCDDLCYEALIGRLYGRMGYDMFYTLKSPYSETKKVLEKAIELGGTGVEYIVLEPLAYIAVYEFQQGNMTADETRAVHDELIEIADYNIERDPEFGEYYDITKQRFLASFKPVEDDIFDCEYFKEKLRPVYDEAPDDFDNLKYIFNTLKQKGCDESDAFLAQVKGEYETLAAEYNAERMAEREANNPGYAAKKRYDEGKFEEAAEKYLEAAEKAEDDEKKAGYYFSLASIQYRKLNKYAEARESALKAAELRGNWGRPYMLIGDMYAQASRSCGDAWNQRLAVVAAIDKYARAKAVDDKVAQEASSRIARYSASRPDKEDAFMRGFKDGSTAKVGCWIGETVTLNF